MEQNKEISALFTLIDDPDEEVFGQDTVIKISCDEHLSIVNDAKRLKCPDFDKFWTPENSPQNRVLTFSGQQQCATWSKLNLHT